MSATVNQNTQFTVAFTVAGGILVSMRDNQTNISKLPVSVCKIKGKCHFATVNLLSHAKSLKTKDATVNPPYREIGLLSQTRVMPCASKLGAEGHRLLPASRERIAG